MRINLYAGENEVTDPMDDLLKLLCQDDPRLAVSGSDLGSSRISVGGDLDLVLRRIQEWLCQRYGRMGTPPSICEQHLFGQGSTVSISVHL